MDPPILWKETMILTENSIVGSIINKYIVYFIIVFIHWSVISQMNKRSSPKKNGEKKSTRHIVKFFFYIFVYVYIFLWQEWIEINST